MHLQWNTIYFPMIIWWQEIDFFKCICNDIIRKKNTEILQLAPSRSTLTSTWTSTPTSTSTIKSISTSTAKVQKWEEGIHPSPLMANNLKMGGPKNPRKYLHFWEIRFLFFITLSKSGVTWYFLSTHSFYNSNSIWWVGLSVCARGIMFIEEEDSKKGRVQLDIALDDQERMFH